MTAWARTVAHGDGTQDGAGRHKEIVRGEGHLRQQLHHITAPTLVVHAREDDTSSLRSAELVAERVSSRILRKVILENSYHIITMDNEKDVVVNETLNFAASV